MKLRGRKVYTISRVSEELVLGIRTIRKYERLGVFPVAKRSPCGYRYYMEEDINLLRGLLEEGVHRAHWETK